MYEYEYYLFYPVYPVSPVLSQEQQTQNPTGNSGSGRILGNVEGFLIPLLFIIIIIYLVTKLFNN